MDIPTFSGVLLLSYILGSIPSGLIFVRVFKGQDLREIHSGRTGGTNAMRAAGFWVGLATTLSDIFKGAGAVWIASALLPGSTWLKVLAPVAAIVGHNYSIFLISRTPEGRWRIGGGAGGAPCLGGALGLWAPSILIIFPLGFLILFGLGYASVTTLSIAALSFIIFTITALIHVTPWHFVIYSLLAEGLLIWALRPNIRRLLDGTERMIGWRAKRLKTQGS